MKEKLGSFIKGLRTEKKWTMRNGSQHLGIAESYLWQIENDKREVRNPGLVKKLAEAYGVPVETILKYAGYAVGLVDNSRVIEAKRKTLYRDYNNLSDQGKKELDGMMRYLQYRYPKVGKVI